MLRSRQRPRVGSGGGASSALALRLDFLSSTALDPRITFSRGTNATQVDSTGKITYAPNNLLTNSEQFDNAVWVKADTTVTANTTLAPDNTITADSLIEAATTSTHTIRQQITGVLGAPYTFSVYLKANTRTQAAVELYTTATIFRVVVNLANGAFISSLGTGTYNITPLANGWYRVSVTGTSTNATINGFVNILSGGAISYAGDGTSGIYVWGAQLELDTYQTTASTYNSTTPKNLLGFTQEFDNAAWTKVTSYVQTNLLLYSEQLSAASWTPTNMVTTVDAVADPNGYQNAEKFAANSTNNEHYVRQTVAVVTGSTFTASVYVKAAGYTAARIRCLDSAAPANGFLGSVELTTGVTTSAAAGIGTILSVTATDAGNGWQRLAVTGSAGATAASILFDVYIVSGTTVLFTGNDVNGLYMWGAQLVQGTAAGNYQRTVAAAAATQYIGPDGYPTAEKLVEDTSNSVHKIQAGVTVNNTTPQTFSCYLKAGERTSGTLVLSEGTPFTRYTAASFDLVAGTASSTTNSGGAGSSSAAIVAIGNGWYRCSITTTLGGVSPTVVPQVAIGPNLTPYIGNGSSGIYLYGAQLSDSASLDPYVYNPAAALTSTAYYGPRLDYDPATLAPKGLLVEEARTNLLTYSTQLDNAAWTKTNSYVQTNLLTYSEQLDNATVWTPLGNMTASANTILSPDGAISADALIENTAATVFHFLNRTVSKAAVSTQYAFSFYAKDKGRELIVTLSTGGGANGVSARVNLSTGTITAPLAGYGTGWTAGSISLTPAGNGWYRVSTVATTDATASFILQFALYNGITNVYTGDGVSGVYLWGAQLVQGADAGNYQQTVATAAATQYTSPDGTNNADKVVEATSTGVHDVRVAATASASTTYTQSIFVKAAERSYVQLQMFGNAGGSTSNYNLLAGTATAVGAYGGWTSATATITNYGNGWYRLTQTATTNVGLTFITFASIMCNTSANASYAGDGTSGMYMWGAQLEAGSFATSYIPTVASTVTRSADVALMRGSNFSNWYNQNEGAFVGSVQAAPVAIPLTGQAFAYPSNSDGTSNINMRRTTSSLAGAGFTVATVIVADVIPSASIAANAIYKNAVAFSLNNVNDATNGVLGTLDTSATMPFLDRMYIGSNVFGGGFCNGYLQSISYYNTRLPDAQLQAITA